MKSAPEKTSVPTQAEVASSSARAQRAVGRSRRAVVRLSVSGRGGDAGRTATAMPATTEAARGSASHVHRQPSSPTAPISGMPTIQAAGGPTSAHESARVRCSFGTHSAAATVPPTRRPATESPRRSWATRRTANVGAAALRADAAASPSAPAAITRRSGTLRAKVPRAIAASPAARPDAVRSCPAAAVETSRSAATFASTGVSAITPA